MLTSSWFARKFDGMVRILSRAHLEVAERRTCVVITSAQFFVLFAAVLTISGCSGADNEQKCKDEAQLGMKQFQADQFNLAEASYQSAADLAKHSANALQYPLMLRELARCQFAQKKFDAAAGNLQIAIDYYDNLSTKSEVRVHQSLLNEREYEALASLGDLFLLQHRDLDAKHAYAKAIALSTKIVEPPSIAGAVNQNYVQVLERTGDHALAVEMQQKIDSSSFTIDEFDERFNKTVAAVTAGRYEGAEKEFERLHMAAKKFVGDNTRCGKSACFLGMMQIGRNSPAQAELNLRDSLNLMPRGSATVSDVCHAYAILSVCRELQGDTKSGIEYYKKAYALDHFLAPMTLVHVRDMLLKSGHPAQADKIRQRLESYEHNPEFNAVPVAALDCSMRSMVQLSLAKLPEAKETQKKGLLHLEQDNSINRFREMRGAFTLYKMFSEEHEPALAKRALKQLYLIGNRSAEGKIQLQKLLRRENLPAQPPS